MKQERIAPDNVMKTTAYAHAIKVGNTIYIAGQVAYDENGNVVGIGDFTAQATQTFENLKRVLEAAGASMKDVVMTTTYFRNIEDIPKLREVRQKYFGDHLVAATGVEVSKLARPELLVEIEAIAVISET